MRNILKVIFGRVLFTVLCLLIQLVWLIGLVWKLNQYYVWFSAVFDIIALIVVLRINAKSDFSAARLVDHRYTGACFRNLPVSDVRQDRPHQTYPAPYEKVQKRFACELSQDENVLGA